MEDARKKFKRGSISKKRYRSQAVMSTLTFLIEHHQYQFSEEVGMGTYGAVVELKQPDGSRNVAAKIVLQEYVTEGEKEIWPFLSHENLLPLINAECIPSTYCYVFITPRLPKGLDVIVEGSTLSQNSNGIERATFWLRGISSGLKYLHGKNLCHLDIKLSNVLISDTDTAVICDFGSLTRTEAATNNYISPFIYRPPEGLKSMTGRRVIVNGFHYDVYTIGMLCLELFTKRALLRSAKLGLRSRWTKDLYPKIFDILQKRRFEALVKSAFPMSKIDRKTLCDTRDFIRGCINLNPQKRPPADDLLQHKIFRGEKDFRGILNDVWKKRYDPKMLEFLVSLHIGRAVQLQFKQDEDGSESIQIESEDFRTSCDSGESETIVVTNRKREEFLSWLTRKNSGLSKVLNRIFRPSKNASVSSTSSTTG